MTLQTQKELLVPVDYSEGSRLALEHAIGLALTLGMSIRVVHVWECMPHAPKDLRVHLPDGSAPLLEELIQAQAEREMSEFLASFTFPKGVPVAHEILSGEPSRRILEVARRSDCKMIVMGTQGRGAVERFVLGSVAQRVIRLSPVSVLAIPSRRREG